MNQERKKVILDEIQYWKSNRLLPKEYCDFLLALYTQGEGVKTNAKQKSFLSNNIFLLLDILLLLILLPVSFLIIYFTEINIGLQMAIIFLFLLISITHFYFFNKKNSIYSQLALIVTLLILFLVTVFVSQRYVLIDFVVYATVSLNCMLWILIGMLKKYYYLVAGGLIGLLMLTFFFLQ
ncbi:membrane-associated HD superfamily phosphohydrolase [Salirhabdus euzebyi]|uniref:Membrane-associated HD superfamily phosphohydrolase n=1 Tax=Salirhabdus euzebyi TaxID=394506 RepID=A0A841Q7N7_9BACI|nr:hypothetical protein [Salirhabdus euzebyi]MBB6454302.1 membrane-associated HD superfamily phosphohydrolase [Salirhabdus euzebyi]